MSRFIFRYRGKGRKPAELAGFIESVPDARIVDDSGRMLLVDASDDALQDIMKHVEPAEWLVAPERVYARPDPRPAPRQAPTSNGS
jgi:hypothetical protein